MTFFKITNIRKPITNIFKYSHHRCLMDIPENIHYIPNNTIINLLGSQKNVDKASWEIKSFAVEKSLFTANIVYDTGILQNLLSRNISQFIVNRCYNISCERLSIINYNIMRINPDFQVYNLYVLPNATNRFNKCLYISTCNKTEIIIYPLAAPEENKRRDIHILIG